MTAHPILSLALAGMVLTGTRAADLRFHPAGDGSFQFDTGILRGKLRAGGKSLGLTAVVHVRSGTTLSQGSGLMTHYRLFSANHRYGQEGAFSLPSDASLRDDGAVDVHWPAAADRPFELWAQYRWTAPATLDVVTTVKAVSEIAGFESFLASYFAGPLTSSLVWVKHSGAFMAAEQSAGAWQIFPRDKGAAGLILDGRWTYPLYPVEWAMRPELEQPLAIRRDGAFGLAALLMAPASDCFAVSTPYQTEAQHRSLYLSLFGRKLKAGQTARARARLQIVDALTDAEALDLYRVYMQFLREGTDGR